METTKSAEKKIYVFGAKNTDGNKDMKSLLGGKGANLAEMSRLGLPVPPGFTITTQMCAEYSKLGKSKIINLLKDEVEKAIKNIEEELGKNFGSHENPLLFSVRSGARASMPGMMDTVLNIGLNDEIVEAIAHDPDKERFAWDSYRRLIQMYGDVVMKINQFTKDNQDPFDHIVEQVKSKKGIHNDQDLSVNDFKKISALFMDVILKYTGEEFPQDPQIQLWNSILAVFESWYTKRAIYYRRINNIPENWGTAVNVQAMVFGNMGKTSASGVAFTRDAATGENIFNGEYLANAQGEDVVAGIRTPLQISIEGSKRWAGQTGTTEEERKSKFPSLEETMPEIYQELDQIQQNLETYYRDMQDLEFTIEEGKLWILQTRTGKRTGAAMINIGTDMLIEGLISEEDLIRRIDPHKLDELLHPVFDLKGIKSAICIARGLPASPGAASGIIAFTPDEAIALKKEGKKTILVRTETSADDLSGMDAAEGILTSRGGMTSHAAVVARGMGKCCISGAGEIKINYSEKTLQCGSNILKAGDWISLNGSTGEVFTGEVPSKTPEVTGDFQEVMKIAEKFATMKVRANADTPEAARQARKFGAKGIGLCRTEHMFFHNDRIKVMRKMIMSENAEDRKYFLDQLLPMQKADFIEIFEAMDGLPVTIRLMDPPLHEFMPTEKEQQQEIAGELGISIEQVLGKIAQLAEINPMLGHRGCRLLTTTPEITTMQVTAILEAAIDLRKKGKTILPEIMVPLTGTVEEMIRQNKMIREEGEKIFERRGESLVYLVGTMIEVPRATLIAGELAEHCDFFSFGTNDLTQMTYGYSRDDAGKFLPFYIENAILPNDPFQILDQAGVGRLINLAVKEAREADPGLKIGICGEHGGDPSSVKFFHQEKFDYVSCSPFRIPVAMVAAAQAAIE